MKTLCALVICLMVLLSSLASATTYTVDPSDPSDLVSHWYWCGAAADLHDNDIYDNDDYSLMVTTSHPDTWDCTSTWTVWEPYDSGDLMIRAVVSDSAGTVVESKTWGSLKSIYIGPRPTDGGR